MGGGNRGVGSLWVAIGLNGFLWVPTGLYEICVGPYGSLWLLYGALWVRQWDGSVRLWDFGAEAESPYDDVSERRRGGKRSGAG